MKTKFLLAILMIVCGLSATADEPQHDFATGGLSYYFVDRDPTLMEVEVGARIYYMNDYAGDIVVPSTVQYHNKTYTVVAVHEKCFFNCPNLRSVKLPETIKRIGDWAFYKAPIEHLDLPASCKELGVCAFAYSNIKSLDLSHIEVFDNRAFRNCEGFSGEFTLPACTREVGSGVFASCPNITAINVDPANTKFQSRDGILYEGSTLVSYPPARSGKFVIPSDVDSIGAAAFNESPGLTDIVFPETVTKIGEWALMDCMNMKTIRVENPKAVLHIGWVDTHTGYNNLDCTCYTYACHKDSVAYRYRRLWEAIDTGEKADFSRNKEPDPVEPDPEEPEGEKTTYTLYFKAGSPWASVNAYVWDEGDSNREYFKSWPGNAMAMDSETGHFKYSFATAREVKKLMVVFNNGQGDQTYPNFEFVDNGVYTKSGFTGDVVKNDSGVGNVSADEGEVIVTVKDNVLYVESDEERTILLVSIDGRVRNLDCSAGLNAFSGISKGIYVINGKKIVM